MDILFLGTSAMTHTKERNQSAVFIKYKNEGLLFDCGEGTQRQMRIAGLKLPSVTRIFLTHWHGDHVLGIPGLMQTLSTSEYSGTLEIYCPKGVKKKINLACEAFGVMPSFPYKITEVEEGVIINANDFFVETAVLKHSVPCVGYSFIERDRRRIKVDVVRTLGIPDGPWLGELQEGKTVEWKGKKILPKDTTYVVSGRKVVYIMDTAITKNCFKLAENADVLVCEATYTSEQKELAAEYLHLTALEAAQLASKANVKKLVLTHFSQRYKRTEDAEKEARTAFDNVICAKDFMRIKV